MRKADIIREIVESTGIETRDVDIILTAALRSIKDNVKQGKRIEIRGFGSFYPKHQKAKKARRPLNGCGLRRSEVFVIPERVKPAFKPSKKYFQCTT